MSPREKFAYRWRITLATLNHVEHFIITLGLLVAIWLILSISHYFIGDKNAPLIVASIGASTVLLFTNPHGALSQPWAIVGGHLISAFIGVTCYQLIADHTFAAAIGVGIAVIAMNLLRCLHPPGAATLLTAILGGNEVHALGYQFVITPVLLNVITLISIGILFNYSFSWRRYPLRLMHIE